MKLTKELVEGMGFKHDLTHNRFISMDGTEMSPLADEGEWVFINGHNQKSLVRSLLEVTNLIYEEGKETGRIIEVNRVKNGIADLFGIRTAP